MDGKLCVVVDMIASRKLIGMAGIKYRTGENLKLFFSSLVFKLLSLQTLATHVFV